MSREFKLTKSYPGREFVGTVAKDKIGLEYETYGKGICRGKIPSHFVENFPEFWMELHKPKDYEILAFRGNKNHPSPGYIVKMKDGMLYSEDQKLDEMHYTGSKCWDINTVKRKDGIIFKIGDEVVFSKDTCKDTITGFKPFGKWNQFMDVRFGKRYTFHEGYPNIDVVEHFIKPAFVTEDEVGIYKGTRFWVVTNSYGLEDHTLSSNEDVKIVCRGRFSTPKKAQDWIFMNKPCLSINDVASVYISASKALHENLGPDAQPVSLLNIVKSKL